MKEFSPDEDLSDAKLMELQKHLEDTTKPAIDRLAMVFCKLGAEFLAFTLAQREQKRQAEVGKGKGKGK